MSLLVSTLWGSASPVKTRAKIVGPARLIVRFDAGLPPRVWQLDLEKHPHFTVEIRQEEGVWHLGVAAPPGVFRPVVAFRHQEAAWEAYLVVRKAIFSQRSLRRLPIRLGWVWLALVAGLAGYLILMPPKVPSLTQIAGGGDPAGLAAAMASLPPGAQMPPEVARLMDLQGRMDAQRRGAPAAAALPPAPTGVPLSADELLRRPHEAP